MNYQIFAWDRSKNKLRREEHWIDLLCLAGLFLAAIVLLTVNLGTLPLLDRPEAIIAQMAKEIWQAPDGSFKWLVTTLWGEPYLDRPTLGHSLIALFYTVGGVNEWTTRLPGALLTACSVPVFYSLGREIFGVRTPALLGAWIYLTFLPVVRYGRLATFDGMVLCFALLTILALLRSRRDLRWSLSIGFGFGLVCLIQGMMGLLLGIIALLFLLWDTPRLLTSFYFWLGIALGSLPAIAWYGSLWLYDYLTLAGIYRQFAVAMPWDASLSLYSWLEILLFSFPWLIFACHGIRLAWRNHHWSWAKLVLIWTGIYITAFAIVAVNLAGVMILLYPVLALAGGAILTEVLNFPSHRSYPRLWIMLLSLLALLTTVACSALYFGVTFDFIAENDGYLFLILGVFALTIGIAAFLISQRDRQFISILFWGLYVSLFLFFSSPHWLWQLKTAYPVKPVAAMIAHVTPVEQVIYTSFDYDRPSLNFYSDRRVIAATTEQLIKHWQRESQPYLLLDKRTLNNLNLETAKILGEAPPNWVILTKKN